MICLPPSLFSCGSSVEMRTTYHVRFDSGNIMFLFAVLGFRWQRRGGEAAQGKHQEAELDGGASGEGAGQAAGRHRRAAGEEPERAVSAGQLLQVNTDTTCY